VPHSHDPVQIPITIIVIEVRTGPLLGPETAISAVDLAAIRLRADRVAVILADPTALARQDPVILADHLLLQEAVDPPGAVPEVVEDVNAQLTYISSNSF